MTIENFAENVEHIGDSSGAKNHDHDIIHELSRRLDGLWRYDQYIANAKDHPAIQEFWQKVKGEERDNVEILKNFVRDHIRKNCF